jgi:hypothetical protein
LKHPTKIEGLEVRSVDGDVLVHDSVHDKVHILNNTAGDVLQMCDGVRSPADIARVIAARTGAELSLVTRDVESILNDFAGLSLVLE